jgi:hypothetical protein
MIIKLRYYFIVLFLVYSYKLLESLNNKFCRKITLQENICTSLKYFVKLNIENGG